MLCTHRYLVSIGGIKPLCDMLGVQDPRVIQITLEGLENILKVGQLDVEKNGGVNPFAVLVEEAFGEKDVFLIGGRGRGGERMSY